MWKHTSCLIAMKNSNYKITKLEPGDHIPFDLLLLADETTEAIEKYIYRSDVYIMSEIGLSKPIAVFVLCKNSDLEMEIKNIAVAENVQGKGIGSFLIDTIRAIASEADYKCIVVGTPDSAYRQIKFYEKNGFSKYGINKDFFIKNYSKPIIEDGMILRDMVMLRIKL
jgi:ribosomal protein S18 acetylase RimI-like enzyme